MKTVIISGGSSGIGQACVNLFLSKNWQVFNLDINEPKAHQTNWIKCDLTHTDDIAKALQQIQTHTNTIDALISNAGKHFSASIENTSDDNFYDVINTNLKSTFVLIREALPMLKANHHGHIITIGSDQCSIAKPNSAVYGLTKAAIGQLTKNIALDYAKYTISANCIAAGTIDTELYQQAVKRYSDQSGIPLANIHQDEASLQPLKRIGKPYEVAELAYFLASGKASYITGAILPIDGGYTTQ
ncbi:SDR family oxidoreductase [Thiotrichales bacterium 19S3-7]|nr:SDR family oxidoreductase [Thiotrichales bacterium 19S3-7]MCF6800991.1 SDR family oxidoreductase [Thiotrichales bacterium 19S3-11]